ncbi:MULTISPECIES: B12-binding domain-containing radical SAM protein [unclassified Peribacillus]|uniref:B12-binding domain-containing radical SAM protein n=1 Tax=unclassified Peribacillus TaxID=2675266 RepID=UPI00366E66A9
MKNSDAMIVFPPLTEARLFPYLSLPMITSFLRSKGMSVSQIDLNIELCHTLFSEDCLNEYVSINENGSKDLKWVYKVEMAKYLLKEQKQLYNNVFIEKRSSDSLKYDVRLVRQGIELLLVNSFLKLEITSLEEILESVRDFSWKKSDIATKTLYENIKEKILNDKPKIFALSIAYYSQILPSLLICKWIRELSPNTHIILGGQQIMIRQSSFLSLNGLNQFVDSLGISAGEETLFMLNRYLKNDCQIVEVPDIVWLNENNVENVPSKSAYRITDALPPDFSDLPYKNYLDEEVHMSLITCVGCYWGRCTFCSYGNRSRKEKSYQQKTARQVANECEDIINNYGVNRINFIDENTNLRLVVNAVKILKSRGYEIKFSTRNRLEDVLLDAGFCSELSNLGCILMSVGYETNSQRILDSLDKGVQSSNYQQIIDNLHNANITLRMSIIGGLPGETEDEIECSEEFLLKNQDKIGIDVMQMLVLEPGTYIYEDTNNPDIHIQSSKNLRGNKLLNYGMGRMGATFQYSDGITFEEKLNRFLQLHKNINPQKNDELPPDKYKKEGLDITSNTLLINPWTKIIKLDKTYIMDFVWQRIFLVPESLEVFGNSLIMSKADDKKYLEYFVEKGVINLN